MTDDDLDADRAAFEARVRATYARRQAPVAGGKGSPPALLVTGAIGTGMLALVAALIGEPLVFLPAAIPLATVLLVLAARSWAGRGGP